MSKEIYSVKLLVMLNIGLEGLNLMLKCVQQHERRQASRGLGLVVSGNIFFPEKEKLKRLENCQGIPAHWILNLN